MEDGKPILSATDVRRDFKTGDSILQVLKGLSIRVQRKEMAAVIGASGVGKSTLLHILGGLDHPTSGTVALDGVSLTGQSETSLARIRNDQVGFVFQSHYLLEDFSPLENVMMPLLVAGSDKPRAASKAEHLLDRVGLRDRAGHCPRQLSGGEQQRVAVARALANDPKIVLADEPSGNLDTATGRMLHDLLFQLNAENGVTFLIATHNRELADRCHRRLEIADGRIVE